MDASENSFEMLSFTKGGVSFGVNMLDVEEIVKTRFSAVNKIPASPKQIMGLMNIRGKVLPIVNASYILSQTKHEHNENDDVTLLISKFDGELIGLIVDKLGDVVEAERLYPIDEGELLAKYSKGVVMENGRPTYLLDIAKLLSASLEMD